MTEKLKTGRNLDDLLCWCCMYFGLCASVLYLITQNSNQFIIALTLAVTLIGTVYLSVRARAIFYIGYHILLIAITWGFSRTLASPGLISTWAITVLILFQMIPLWLFSFLFCGSYLTGWAMGFSPQSL